MYDILIRGVSIKINWQFWNSHWLLSVVLTFSKDALCNGYVADCYVLCAKKAVRWLTLSIQAPFQGCSSIFLQLFTAIFFPVCCYGYSNTNIRHVSLAAKNVLQLVVWVDQCMACPRIICHCPHKVTSRTVYSTYLTDGESSSTLDTNTALPVVVSQEQDTKNCQELKWVRFTHATLSYCTPTRKIEVYCTHTLI